MSTRTKLSASALAAAVATALSSLAGAGLLVLLVDNDHELRRAMVALLGRDDLDEAGGVLDQPIELGGKRTLR